jgi:hypothetical protein
MTTDTVGRPGRAAHEAAAFSTPAVWDDMEMVKG